MYVCNCNGIRTRDVQSAIACGARRPADVFRHCQGAAQCAKCVCDMRRMIQAADLVVLREPLAEQAA